MNYIFSISLLFIFLFEQGICSENNSAATADDLFAMIEQFQRTDGIGESDGDDLLAFNWLQKDGIGTLCNGKMNKIIEISKSKFGNNWKIFCEMRNNGQGIGHEKEGNLKKIIQNLDENATNFTKNKRKIIKNEYLNVENREKMAKLLDQFIVGLNIFQKFAKAKNLSISSARNNLSADDSHKNAFRQMARRKRRDDMKKEKCFSGFVAAALSATGGTYFGVLLGHHLHHNNGNFNWTEIGVLFGLISCVLIFLIGLAFIWKHCIS